jgi:epsilon-lactone hydrolase
MPSALGLITPVIDFAGKGETFVSKAEKDPFQLKDPLGIVKMYVGANNPLSPVISPLYGDMENLPAILSAELEKFVKDID